MSAEDEYQRIAVNKLEDEIRGVLAGNPINHTMAALINTLALFLATYPTDPTAVLKMAVEHLREVTKLYIKAVREAPREKLH